MKSVVVFLFLFLTVFDSNFVESGIILDRIKTGISDTKRTIECGVNKIGGFVTRQETNCEPNEQDEKTNEVVPEKNGQSETTESSEKVSSSTESAEEKPTTKTESSEKVTSSTESAVVPVSDGRRLIAVGANCPEGQRADAKGNCREEY